MTAGTSIDAGHGTSACPRETCAGIRFSRVRFIDCERVVDEEFFPFGYGSQDDNVQLQQAIVSPALDSFTVRLAAVIEVPQFVAILGAVNDRSVRQLEEIGEVAVPVHGFDFCGRQASTFIHAQTGAGGEGTGGEEAKAVDRTGSDFEERSGERHEEKDGAAMREAQKKTT